MSAFNISFYVNGIVNSFRLQIIWYCKSCQSCGRLPEKPVSVDYLLLTLWVDLFMPLLLLLLLLLDVCQPLLPRPWAYRPISQAQWHRFIRKSSTLSRSMKPFPLTELWTFMVRSLMRHMIQRFVSLVLGWISVESTLKSGFIRLVMNCHLISDLLLRVADLHLYAFANIFRASLDSLMVYSFIFCIGCL